MNATPKQPTLRNASDLWTHLVHRGVIVPNSYDKDVADLLDQTLPGSGSLPNRMGSAEWTPRDLLRAISPVLDSFTELVHDLLSLYSDISAKYGTEDSLTISYEFNEGDTFDQSLFQFRKTLNTLKATQAAYGTFVFPNRHWEYPAAKRWDLDSSSLRSLHTGKDSSWDFNLPMPPQPQNASLERGVSLVYSVLNAACNILRKYGHTMDAVDNNSALRKATRDELHNHLGLYFAFTNFFPEQVIMKLQSDINYLETRSVEEVDNWLQGIEKWCSSFWNYETLNLESAIEDVLSLPMWGKRHELFSAWVVCIIANAFGEQELDFEVVNERLRFPFKATKIAAFEDRTGPVELWSEVRSTASGNLAHGRKRGVQPDYRFLRPGQEPINTEMAIEVKHYLRAAASRHGDTARDYARALPKAQVSLVAQGPIGKTAINRVGIADRERVSFHESVRSLLSVETDAVIQELKSVFPPANPKATGIHVVRAAVNEVEIQLVVQEDPYRELVLGRNSDDTVIDGSARGELVLVIVCHPERHHTIDTSSICISMSFSTGEVKYFKPSAPAPSTRWHIGTLYRTSFLKSADTVESSDGFPEELAKNNI